MLDFEMVRNRLSPSAGEITAIAREDLSNLNICLVICQKRNIKIALWISHCPVLLSLDTLIEKLLDLIY